MDKEKAMAMMEDVLDGVCNNCRRLVIETGDQLLEIKCATLNRTLLKIHFPTFMGETAERTRQAGCPHRTETW